jgi:hypothetical protein
MAAALPKIPIRALLLGDIEVLHVDCWQGLGMRIAPALWRRQYGLGRWSSQGAFLPSQNTSAKAAAGGHFTYFYPSIIDRDP